MFGTAQKQGRTRHLGMLAKELCWYRMQFTNTGKFDYEQYNKVIALNADRIFLGMKTVIPLIL